MREIKCRGLTEEGQWVYGQYYHAQVYIDGHSCCDIYLIRNDGDEDYQVKENTISQYTGLKDKNDKDIYESDIVKAPHDFGPAGFSERTFVVHFDTNVGYQWNYWLMEEAEIIGNIYEHGHLLPPKYEHGHLLPSKDND